MAKIVGRRPVEIKLSDQLNGYIPVFDSSSQLWSTISKSDFISGSNIFIGDQTISGSFNVSGSLIVNQGITGSLLGTASYADNAWAIGGNTFSGSDANRILGTLSDHGLSIFTSGSRVATFTNSGSFILGSSLPNPANALLEAKFTIEAGITERYNLIKATSDVNNYSQFSIRNLNSGSNASSDIVAVADNGDESINYINVGINSSTFTGNDGGKAEVGDANDAYLYSTGNHLHIGNASNYPIQFFAGGENTDTNRKLQLDPNNNHQMTGSLDVSGSVVAQSFTGSLQGSSSYALTASYADNFTVGGTLTAQTIVAQTITSSTEFITGSTRNGSLLTNTHEFTGSVSITGSLEINGRDYINESSSFDNRITTNSSSFTNFSGSYVSESSSFASRITTDSASFAAFSGSYMNESSSFASRITTDSSSFASFSGSYISESSSFAGRITTDSASFASFSGSYVSESSSFASRITTNSSSFADFSGSYVSESSSFASRITTDSSSFTEFSGSYINESSSFADRITINSSSFTVFSGSYINDSASFADRIATDSSSFTVFSGSYLIDSASFDTRILNNSASISSLSSSFNTFSGSYNTGSFTGSFNGELTGSFSGSLYNLQNTVLGHIPFFSSSQVLADSIVRQLDNGSGSYSIVINQENITTAAPEALYVYQPSATSYNVISGKGNLDNYLQLNIQNTNTGENASSDVVATANNGDETSNYINMGINSDGFTGSIGNENDAYLYSTGNHLHIGNVTPNQPLGFFVGGDEVEVNRKLVLYPNNKHEVTGSLNVTEGVTASLHGTASWANNAINSTSASYAVTASLAINANNATNANTASYVLNAISASYAATASNAPDYLPLAGGTLTGDLYAVGRTFQFQDLILGYGTTFGKITTDGSKYISIMPNYNVESARFWPNGNVTIQDAGTYVDNGFRLDVSGSGRFTDGLTVTGSLQAINGITGSLFGTSSYSIDALSSSFATSASYWSGSIINAATASYVLQAVSSSYAATASFANDFTVRGTLTAQTINVQTITSSIDFVTGSSVNGSLLTNTHQFTGSVGITGSLTVNNSEVILTNQTSSMSVATASFVTLAQTASYVLQAVSASFSSTASSVNQLNQNVVVSGSLTVSGSTNIIGSSGTTLLSSNADTLVFTGSLFTTGSIVSTGSLNILGGITGSLLGTASYAAQSLSASYWSGSIINAESSSYASNADLLDGKDSTIFATTGSNIFKGDTFISASFAKLVLNSPNLASIDFTANQFNNYIQYDKSANTLTTYGLDAVITNEASVGFRVRTGANNNTTKLLITGSTIQISGSLFTSGSSVFSGSVTSTIGFTGSLVGTASYATQALSASYWSGSITNSATASYVQTAQTASYVLNAVSASNASTASYLNPIENSYLVLSQVSQSLNFQDDTEAAAGGVPLGGLYRNGNFILIRIV
jgi:hypothetical protein